MAEVQEEPYVDREEEGYAPLQPDEAPLVDPAEKHQTEFQRNYEAYREWSQGRGRFPTQIFRGNLQCRGSRALGTEACHIVSCEIMAQIFVLCEIKNLTLDQMWSIRKSMSRWDNLRIKTRGGNVSSPYNDADVDGKIGEYFSALKRGETMPPHPFVSAERVFRRAERQARILCRSLASGEEGIPREVIVAARELYSGLKLRCNLSAWHRRWKLKVQDGRSRRRSKRVA
ncbi:hypothetical protein PAPYR_4716 [Paratrimastix pyriformis]|uniref:Uncharacterized protein n=1 Tax=Paratrimastix pyriformis TaxID=342808 RepID=A0ABQ8UPZ4_9EUKA|nr:hypothetical protein PAPYR_4716 [Paratrimastix pyriformis]